MCGAEEDRDEEDGEGEETAGPAEADLCCRAEHVRSVSRASRGGIWGRMVVEGRGNGKVSAYTAVLFVGASSVLFEY